MPADAALGDGGGSDAHVRTCNEGAAVTDVSWQRVDTGLQDLFWTANAPERGAARGLSGVAHGNGVWVALGDNNVSGELLRWATSVDGVRWQTASQPTSVGPLGARSRLSFVRGQFVFFAQHDPLAAVPRLHMYTSVDGKSWSAREFTQANYVFDLANSDREIVVSTGPTQLWHSPDLQTWTNQRLYAGSEAAGSTEVAYGAGRWLAGIVRSSVVDGVLKDEGQIFSSTDAVAWQPLALSGASGFSLEYGSGVWVATNAEGMYQTSSDGQTFSSVTPTGPWSGARASWRFRLRHAGGRFLSYVIDPQTPPRGVQITSSLDGRAWSNFGEVGGEALPAGATNVEYSILDVAYADCRYVIAGRYEVTVPGALDPPAFRSEIGPFLITADLASQPGAEAPSGEDLAPNPGARGSAAKP